MERITKIIPLLLLFCSFQYVYAQQKEPDIIPKPVSVEMGNGYFTVTEQTLVTIGGRVPNENAAYISERLTQLTGYALRTMLIDRTPKGSISFQVDNKMTSVPAQGYQLNVGSDGVRITAPDVEGVMNGAQTLFQIMTDKGSVKNRIPYVKISDYPRFGWRGMMLDVSRQFFDKAFVMRYIDWLAVHKINIFHWHLTDDNGWRIEIKSYPDLTLKGAWRGPGEVLAPSFGSGNQRYGGFYTQDDIREVVAYAKARGVNIMPEIEIPGHSRAVVGSYPHVGCNTADTTKSVQGEVKNVWCVGKEENYRMLDKIIGEMTRMFPFEYIHIAGDEVNMSAWKSCPDCQALMVKQGFTELAQLQNYFVRRVEKIIEKHGRKMGGWNEIMKGGELSPQTEIFAWQGLHYGIESARKGYNTIIMPGQYLYFDMSQTPEERGHRWASNITDTRRVYLFDPAPDSLLNAAEQKRIKGVQGALFSEYLDRPARFAEYQSYPRITALSEMGWTPQKDRQWDDFYTRLTRSHLKRLADIGIAFRDFPPQVIYKNGMITVTLPYEGAVVRYDAQGKEPTLGSPVYSQPIPTTDYERYMFRTFFNEVAASPTVKVRKDTFAEWDFSGTSKSFTNNITKEIDKSGVWHLAFKSASGDAKVAKVALSQNGKVIREYADNRLLSQNPRYSFPIDHNASHTYSVSYTLEKTSGVPVKGTAIIECSLYQEPQVNVSSSLTENQRFPISNLKDWNFETYYRTDQPCKNGDWILFEFPQPVVTSRIEVMTGIPNQSRYGVTDGYVSYSYDGVNFTQGDVFDYGNASISPSQAVKAVKIMITGINNEPLVAIQNLRILRD